MYCWWFRHPARKPPFGWCRNRVNELDKHPPTSTGEFTGFLVAIFPVSVGPIHNQAATTSSDWSFWYVSDDLPSERNKHIPQKRNGTFESMIFVFPRRKRYVSSVFFFFIFIQLRICTSVDFAPGLEPSNSKKTLALKRIRGIYVEFISRLTGPEKSKKDVLPNELGWRKMASTKCVYIYIYTYIWFK